MKEAGESVAPPRLLLGVAFLYWGAVAGHPLVGLLCAFLVEARWWLDLRWTFGEAGFSRAWKLSILLMVLAAFWLWMQGESVLGIFELLVWLPVLFLPVLLAQQYSVEERVPLNTFSYVAKRKMQLDRAAGREVHPVKVHLGYAYYCLILVGGCLANPSMQLSFVTVVAFGGVGLFFASPLSRMRPWAWGLGMLAALAIALGGATGIKVLWELVHGGRVGFPGGEGIGNEAHTAIGTLGEVKQSNRIRWRIGMDAPGTVRLFKTAAYNRYGHGVWNHRPVPPVVLREEDYEDMASVGGVDGEVMRWAFRNEDLQGGQAGEGGYHVRGAAQARFPTTLPLAEGARVLTGVEAEGITFNPLGTVRVENPDRGVVDFTVASAEGNLPENESPPNNLLDLTVPLAEQPALQRTCEALGLARMDDGEKVEALGTFFSREFIYTLTLSDGKWGGPKAETAITRFLEGSRRGHCEYFGTAAALLLRQAGVPTRYCEGFGAQEWDLKRREWVLRGIHSHAWCRAYVGGHTVQQAGADGVVETVWTGGRWVDVDLTPPGWLTLEQRGANAPILAGLLDWWQRVREDFLVWRTRPANRLGVTIGISAVAVLLLVYVTVRLWGRRTRRRRKGKAARAGGAGTIVTPLHALERKAEALLGPRPAGVSLTRWLLRLQEAMPGEADTLQRAVELHWKARFDPLGAEDSERRLLETACRDLQQGLRRVPRS